MRALVIPICSVCLGSLTVACVAADPQAPVRSPELQAMVRAAVADAARRTGAEPASITVVSAEPVTWPDSSMGCPQPGRSYMQVLVAGHLIRLLAGKDTLAYHAGARGEPFYCAAGRSTAPAAANPRI
jgi:hypothetical protein